MIVLYQVYFTYEYIHIMHINVFHNTYLMTFVWRARCAHLSAILFYIIVFQLGIILYWSMYFKWHIHLKF